MHFKTTNNSEEYENTEKAWSVQGEGTVTTPPLIIFQIGKYFFFQMTTLQEANNQSSTMSCALSDEREMPNRCIAKKMPQVKVGIYSDEVS